MTGPGERRRPSGPRARTVRPSGGGIGRKGSPAAEAVSDDLRRGAGAVLDRRRRIAALSLGAMSALGVVAAYQNGLIRRLPEPPLPGLGGGDVDASAEAYQYLKTPDAALGLASQAVTLVLAGMGGRHRASERPWVPLALAAKVVLDAAGGAYLTAEQASRHKRFCSWCLAAALANVATVPQVLPEARAAWRSLLGRGD